MSRQLYVPINKEGHIFSWLAGDDEAEVWKNLEAFACETTKLYFNKEMLINWGYMVQLKEIPK